MIRNPFTWSPDVSPAPVKISPVTGRPIAHNHEWQLRAAVSRRGLMNRWQKGWQTRRAGRG